MTETGADSDGDGQSDYAETIYGTDPLSSSSRFEASITRTEEPPGAPGQILKFETILNRRYTVLYSTSLKDGEWQPVSDPVAGIDGEVTVSLAMEDIRGFYRVSVEKLP